jgi:diacylglycerol kinase family enzyme
MPLGTANDLVHNLGLPLDLPSAAQAIAGGRTKRIDVGTVNGWLFANNSAVGLEPVVSIHNMRMKWARGVFRYLLAALRAIAEKPSWHMDLTWDDGNDDGPTSLVSVGNCPLTGGLFRMAPAADPTDGKLTFTYGFAATRRKMLTLLPRAISGDFVNDAAITQLHTTHLRIECREPSPLQVDGEVRETAGEIFEYEVLPQRLAVLAL